MALIKSSLLSDIRGSIGGTTYSRTRAGMIARNRTQPVQPNTAFQVQQRSFMSAAVDEFKALTPGEIADWNDAIAVSGFTMQNAVGDSYVPSAKQVFTMASLNLTKQNLGVPTAPDLSKFLANPNLPSLTYGTTDILVSAGPPVDLGTLQVNDVETNTVGFIEFSATIPQLPTIRNYKKYLRVVGQQNIAADTPTVIGIEAAYLARYTGLNWTDMLGLSIGLALRSVASDNGLASAWFYIGQVSVPAAA